MNNYIYLDNSSTTKLSNRVLYKMMPYLTEYYGNASTPYELGKISKKAINTSREKIAKMLNVLPEEIYFTGSGTEADNMAICGIARANKEKGKHIITSKFEHLAVLNACKRLQDEGYNITYIDIKGNGIVDVKKLKEAIRTDTILISIMCVNNEIGTIQPIDEIADIARENNVIFHTDAVQAVPHMKIDASKYDALSLSGHKFNGPKGVGALYIKKGVNFENILYGGHQECTMRPGTENVAGIVGMASALEYTQENLKFNNEKEEKLRNYLISKLENIPGFCINGDLDKRVGSNLNFYFENIDSDELKLFLEMNRICISGGSACNSNVKELSHVLKSIGKEKSSIRISLSANNTFFEMDKVAYTIKKYIDLVNKKQAKK